MRFTALPHLAKSYASILALIVAVLLLLLVAVVVLLLLMWQVRLLTKTYLSDCYYEQYAIERHVVVDYILGVPRREVEWPGEPEIVGRTEGEEIGIGRVERLLDSVHSNVKGIHPHLVQESHQCNYEAFT